MQYCTLQQIPVWTSSQVQQGGSQLMQDVSQTQQTWNTNVINEYNGPNSRVQPLQSFSVVHSQAHLCRQTTNQNSAGVTPSVQYSKKKDASPLLVSLLREKPLQNDNQTLASQSPSSTISKNTTPLQHVSVEWQQYNASSYSQHSGPQQGCYQSSNSGVAGPTSALDSLHPKTSSTESSFYQQSVYGQNSSPNSTQGYSTRYPANVGILTHQSAANSCMTISPVYTQLLYLPNRNLQTNLHSGQLSAMQDNSETVSSNLNYYRPPPPPYRFNHLSNQIVQSPATVLNKNCNGNVAQLPPLQPKMPQSVSPGTVLFLPPQPSFPNNASVGSAIAGSGGGQLVHGSPPNNNIVPERNPVTSLSKGSQAVQTLVSRSSQTNSKNEVITQIKRWLEELPATLSQKLPSRAVAVVQPLSQEKANISTNTTSRDPLINPQKGCVLPTGVENGTKTLDVGSDIEHPTTKRSNKVVPNTNTGRVNSGSKRRQSVQESEVRNRKSPQCLSKEHLGRKKAKASPSLAPGAGLSSLPTTTWTAAALKDFIQETEKSQVIPADSPSGLQVKLQHMYEEIVHQNVNNGSWKKDFLPDVKHFCDQHVTPDTVVLSQVKDGFKEQLKHYHVLGDGMYSEQPYKSLWLNVNEKLDDIDKEFGFPWPLRRHFYVDESDRQKDEEKNQYNLCKPTINEVPERVLSVSEVGKDQTSTVQSPATPTAPDSAEEDSTDPNYLFKIEVLTPEEAKAFYEEVQKDNHSTGGQKEIAEIDQKKTNPPTEATSTGSDAENLSVDPIDLICCLGKFMERNLALNTPTVKCLCKEKQEECKSTDEESTDKGPDSDPEIQEIVVEDDCERSDEDLPTQLCQIIVLTDDDTLDSPIIEEPMTEPSMTVDHLSDVDMTSGPEDNEPSDSFEEIPNLVIGLSEPQEEFSTEETTSSQISLSNSSDDCTKQAEPLKLSSPVASVPLQTPEEEDKDEQTSSKSDDETRVEIKNPADISLKTNSKKLIGSRYRNVTSEMKQRSLCTLLPPLKEVQDSTSENKSVKLVLFGSTNQEKCGSPAFKMSHLSSPTLGSAGAQQPPQVVSVNVKSSRKNPEEAAYSRKPSVKQLIYEKWSKSFPSCYRNKTKKKKKKKQQNCSEMTDSDGKKIASLRRKRTKSLPSAVGVKEAKRRKYSVSLEQTAPMDQRNTDHEVPLQDNIILKFSMLPSTFSFKEGVNVGTESSNGVSGEPSQT